MSVNITKFHETMIDIFFSMTIFGMWGVNDKIDAVIAMIYIILNTTLRGIRMGDMFHVKSYIMEPLLLNDIRFF